MSNAAGAFAFDAKNATAFEGLDVARCYRHRPPYAPALYERFLGLLPARHRLLDLGCGPGKIARALAPYFRAVVAVDPSAPMLVAGQESDDGKPQHISWVCARAEDFVRGETFDAIAIGAAVHWMQQDVVFPKMLQWLEPAGVLAIISGDGVSASPWEEPLRAFVIRWLARVGRQYDEKGFRAAGLTYLAWMDVQGSESFVFDFEQPLDDFIECEHSRATWARDAMGEALAREFDRDLQNTLAPFARDGLLRFQVKSNLTWGRPRSVKKEELG
jgi:SAM-dependent methyltransferase